MKIAYVINSMGSGGAERLILDLCKEYGKKGLYPDVITLTDRDDVYTPELLVLGIRVINLSHRTSLYSPFFLAALVNVLSSYDIVHVHLFPAQYWVAMAGRLLPNLKIVVTEHSTFNERRKGSFFWIERTVYSRYQKIVCISQQVLFASVNWLPFFKEKFTLIHNGIDIDRFRRTVRISRRTLEWTDSDIIVVMLARLTPEKDHETLLRAISLLPKDYKLLLLGEGTTKELLATRCKELGIQRQVSFLGFRSDAPEILKTCDVSVLSTNWEGFGLVAIESMAAGVPFIGSDIPVLREVAGEAGIFFEKGNPEDLACKIRKVCTDQRFRAQYLEKSDQQCERFSIQKTAEKHLELYHKLT